MTDKHKNTHIGRPSKLTQEMVDGASNYMVYDYANVEDAVPSVAGLAIYLGVNKSTLYEFTRVDSELGRDFSVTLTAIKEKQEKMLISGGLKSTFNSTIVKLMMANHGYSDKIEQDITSSDGTMTPQAPIYKIVKE